MCEVLGESKNHVHLIALAGAWQKQGMHVLPQADPRAFSFSKYMHVCKNDNE